MKRDLMKIYGVLKMIDMHQDEAKGAVIPDDLADDPDFNIKRFLPLMVEDGLVALLTPQAEMPKTRAYRLTWKGHCFIDLYEISEEYDINHLKPKGVESIGRLILDIALAGFHGGVRSGK